MSIKKLAIGLVMLTVAFSMLSGYSVKINSERNANQLLKYDLNDGLVGYWNFDENSGNVLHDVSGHGNDGTIYGAIWVKGVKGSALSFDGVHSFVNCGNNTNLNIRTAITIAAWIHPMADGWKYVRPIYLDPATQKKDYQVKIVLNTSNFDYSKVRPDGGDLRFYQADGTKLSYWVEDWNPYGTSIIWVKVEKKNTNKIYMYYGNTSATSESNGAATFDFFDDFSNYNDGSPIDGVGGWITKRIGGNGEATIRVENDSKYLHLSSTDRATSIVHAVNADNSGYAIRTKEFADEWDQSYSLIFSNGETNSEGDPMNGYEIAWWGWDGAYTKIRKWVDGETTEIASVSDSDKNYVNHTLEFVWYNSSLLGYRDGKLIINATDTTYISRTYIQLREWQDSSRYVDWVLVRKYASPEPRAMVGQETVVGVVFKAGSYGVGASTTEVSGSINTYLISGKISHGWDFVVLTYDGLTEKLFINGSLVTNKMLPATTNININTNNLLIGFLFKGAVDELRIYNRSLDANEIRELYYQVVPKAPQNFKVEKERMRINLTWSPPENNKYVDIWKYEIYRSEDGINYNIIGSSKNTSYSDTFVKEGQSYYYYVVSVTTTGVVGDASEKIVVDFVIPPLSPLNLNVTVGNGYVNLTWDIPSDDGGSPIIEYKIYRNGVLIATISAKQVWYNDTKVKNGVTYTYYVTAVNSVGESKPSKMVNAKPASSSNSENNNRNGGGRSELLLLWIIIGIIIIVGVLIGIILLFIRRKRPIIVLDSPEQEREATGTSQPSSTYKNDGES